MRTLALVTEAFGGFGGIAKFNRDFLRALCSRKDCDEVVTIPRILSNAPEGLPPRLTYVTEGINSVLKYIFTAVKKSFSGPKFDLIFCGHIHLLPLAWVLRLFMKAPILLAFYGIDAWQPVNRWFSSFFVRHADYFIWISEFTKTKFLGWTALKQQKGFVLHPSIHVNKYDSGSKNENLVSQWGLKGKIVLMTLGRLASVERYKGFDEVLEALPDLIKEIPNISYLIVGDGEDRKRLEEKAKQLGISDRVIFTGFVPELQKADYYRLADAFVMPGRGEGFGIVYLEAMACGIPVVASKADGSREAVRNGELGILVDPASPEEIKRGILDALKQPRGVVPQGLDYFSYENFEKRVHAILDQIVPRRSKVL